MAIRRMEKRRRRGIGPAFKWMLNSNRPLRVLMLFLVFPSWLGGEIRLRPNPDLVAALGGSVNLTVVLATFIWLFLAFVIIVILNPED